MGIGTRATAVAMVMLAAGPALADDAAARRAIQSLAPAAKIESIAPTPMPGMLEAVIDGQVVYVSADGAFVVSGEIWRVAGKQNLTAQRKDSLRHDAMAGIGPDQRIVFAAEKPKHTVAVFTDFDCGYCRKLHQDIAAYNKLGISVEYLLYPRGGLSSPSFERAVSVWCAVDRKEAFTLAKQGVEPEHKVCANGIAESFALGNRVGVAGTPTMVTEQGGLIGTYLTPEQLAARLDAVSQ